MEATVLLHLFPLLTYKEGDASVTDEGSDGLSSIDYPLESFRELNYSGCYVVSEF
jgi:hypothetical protein